jgi:uncharacterized membrane protein YqjE
MPDKRLSTWLLSRGAGAPDGAMRGVLSALWSFLQHPAATFEEHLATLEERLRVLEARLVGDLETAANTGVAAVEETVAGVEHRLEDDLKRAIRGRVATVQARLETVRIRVVEDLKHELRRVALVLALVMGCGVLALVGMTFGLMAAWTDLESYVGAVAASLALAILFLLASLVVFGLLRSVVRHPQPLPAARKTAT